MATPDEVLSMFQEVARRGLRDQLSPRRQAQYDEAVRRGMVQVQNAPAERTIGDRLIGTGEAALTFLTGSLAEPVAGLGGIAQGVSNLIRGDDADSLSAADRVNAIREQLTFQPRSETGEDFLEIAATPFEMLAQGAQGAGEFVQDVTGSPLAATAVRSAIELAPSAVGVRGTPRRVQMRQAARERASGIRQSTGVDPGARPDVQAGQIADAVAQETGGRTVKGEDFELVQGSIRRAQDARKGMVDQLYEEARATPAAVRSDQLKILARTVRQSLRDYDLPTMPNVSRRLAELDQVFKMPANSAVRLNSIANFRKRLNKKTVKANDTPQQAALGIIKGQLDEFLDAQFNADMISGDPAAVSKWKAANEAFREYAADFKDDRVVRRLWEQEATPQEVKNWVIGANAVGAKAGAANVVKRIKRIVGEDSAAMRALRQEAAFDIVQPLLSDNPSIKRFKNNYDAFVRKNDALMRELFPDSTQALKDLRDVATAADKVKDPRISVDLNNAISQWLFGHEIAQGSLRVGLARQALGVIRGVVGKSRQRKVMSEIMGYDPDAPLITTQPVFIGGAVQTGARADDILAGGDDDAE